MPYRTSRLRIPRAPRPMVNGLLVLLTMAGSIVAMGWLVQSLGR